jgi:serine/alanine adding enzyme
MLQRKYGNGSTWNFGTVSLSIPKIMYQIITDIDSIDRMQWEKFVYDHPQGNVFQTPQMYAAYYAAKNYQPIIVACYEKDSLVGILLAVIQKEYKGFLGKLSARSIIWGGPLIKNMDINILKIILNSYDNITKKKAIYSQFRNLTDLNMAKPVFANAGYQYEEHLNILVDLKMSEEELWKSIHSKRRNEIRRADKEKTDFSVHQDESALKNGYKILNEVYKFAKLPIPDISLFQNLLSQSTKDFGLKIFAANNQNRMIGVMFVLIYKNRIYDWYAGSYRETLDKYPNDLIPWEVMKWGKANGVEILDFGGAGKPNIPYGVRDYKLKFGGELVNFGRYEKVHQSFKMSIAKSGFKIWQFLKK